MNEVKPDIIAVAQALNCLPEKQRGNRYQGGNCPAQHGSEKGLCWVIYEDTQTFRCYHCEAGGDVWGLIKFALNCDFKDALRWATDRGFITGKGHNSTRGAARTRPAPPTYRPRKIQAPPPRPELAQALTEFQKALPGSLGEKYLTIRGISLEVAQAAGVGYASSGRWPNPKRDWRWGRLVFPHSNPTGELVNFYGRAVGSNEKVPKANRHDHLTGRKGYFNARVLVEGSGALYICEGAFDALAMIAAGFVRTVAIFGVTGWRWEWARNIDALVFCLDTDEAGQTARAELAQQAAMRGKSVGYLPPEALGEHKDISDAWAAGALGRFDPPQAEHNIMVEIAAWPAERREAWEEKAAMLEYENKMARPEAERAAYEMLQGSVGA